MTSAVEIDGGGIAAADDDGNAFSALRSVGTGYYCRERRGAAGLGDNSQHLPQHVLGLQDRFVRYEHGTIDVLLGDWKNAVADPARRKRIRRNTARIGIDGVPGLQSPWSASGKRTVQRRLPLCVPHTRRQRLRSGRRRRRRREGCRYRAPVRQAHPDGALPEHGLVLVERMHRQCAGVLCPGFAGSEGVGIALAFDRQIGAVLADTLQFGWRRDSRNEDLCWYVQLHGRICDSGAMIAARCRDHARCRNLAGQQICESAPRLEGTRMLEKLQLETKLVRCDPDIGAGYFNHRRAADVRPDDLSMRTISVRFTVLDASGIATPLSQYRSSHERSDMRATLAIAGLALAE